MEMSGFFKPAAAKMSTTSPEETALDTIWRMALSNFLFGAMLPDDGLCQYSPHCLKEAHIIPNSNRFVVRH
jgi:hypothetical protein